MNCVLADEASFRQLVSWLENQKIRQFKVEDRVGLEKIDDIDGWPKAFQHVIFIPPQISLECALSSRTSRALVFRRARLGRRGRELGQRDADRATSLPRYQT